MIALAPVSALEVRLGVPVGSISGADLTRIEAVLDDVSALVREEAGRDWVEDDVVTAPASVLAVVYAVALRTYRNPEGYVSENVGSGAYGYSLPKESTGCFLSDEERRIVKRAALGSTGSSGAFSIRTPSAYVPTESDRLDLA